MLYEKWKEVSENHENEQEEVKFWEEFLRSETNIYINVLNNKTQIIAGKVSDLAEKYGTSTVFFLGFLDGINESIEMSQDLEKIEEDTQINIKIDWEKLYYNMVDVEAHWLYNLKGWNEILDANLRKNIQKEHNKSKIVVKDDKIGRNDPCPCGSGKKYKKCCGK
ncbi:SEC-C metal-binding domain-containing protein [Peptostreptococcus equinus]|uniref:SEC-C metal-binding domain-containing protein n=1 Tax=Peptostreptococcus equinus TaxID=3003601 RepID=A0ABY7JNP2_9FIRM|nr:SEC-C metal-binding domain-containing protein [Peptostreptococcus sp. CBA3647]WAW14998.1 SEC-C metal-binding domain-containing protein [Peptostreptococcus sp. CBA3647]